MFVKRQVTDPLADSDGGDDWRRQLIERLADIQVALWATEQDGDGQHPGAADGYTDAVETHAPFMPQIDPHLIAAPESVFFGLDGNGGHAVPHTVADLPQSTLQIAPDTAQGYAAWDNLDEKRHLLSLARTISHEPQGSRSSFAVLSILGLATVGLLGIAGMSLLSGTTLADVTDSIKSTRSGVQNGHSGTDQPRSRPLPAGAARFASLHSMESIVLPPARNAAAENLAGLLAGDAPPKPRDNSIITFRDGQPDVATLMPRLSMEIMANGEATLPFTLATAGTASSDTLVLVAGLPGGVAPIVGASSVAGLWSFKLADLGEQRLVFPADAQGRFIVKLAILQPNGEILSQTAAEIEIKQPAVARAATPARVTQEPTRDAVEKAAQKARAQEAARRRAAEVTQQEAEEEENAAAAQRKPSTAKSKLDTQPERRMALGASKSVNPPLAPKPAAIEPPNQRAKPPEPRPARSTGTPSDQPSWSPFKDQ